jgi:hypothetical protein
MGSSLKAKDSLAIKKFTQFYATRWFITALWLASQPASLASHLPPPRATPIHSEPCHTIHCNSISLQCGPPSMFVWKFCAYFSYPQCVPHAPSISISLSFLWWPKKHSVGRSVHWASYPAAKLEHFNRLSFLLSSLIAAIPLCCSTNCNVVQSKHNNIFNSVQLATCFSYSNHHQADVSELQFCTVSRMFQLQ